MSDSLWPHEPQHTRPSCPSLALRVHPKTCPLSQWCHPTISSSVVPFSCLHSFPPSWSFQMSQLFTSGCRSIKSFSFNISPSSEHLGLNPFRMDWMDLLGVHRTLKSLLQHQSQYCPSLKKLTLAPVIMRSYFKISINSHYIRLLLKFPWDLPYTLCWQIPHWCILISLSIIILLS